MHKDSLIRKKKIKNRNPIIIIVCEGRKTEPNYIRALVEYIKINHASVKIEHGNDKPTPQQLVQKAREKMADYGYTEGIDKTFIVCDTENHTSLEAAKQDAKGNNITLITSNPCFEYWILLHFENTTKPYENCSSLTKYLKEKYTYKKDGTYKNGNFLSLINNNLDHAINRANQIKQNSDYTSGSDMPELISTIKKQAIPAYKHIPKAAT